VPCAGETSANSGLFAAPRGSGMSAAAVRAALRLPPNCRGHGNSAAFCRKPLQCAGVAADGNPPPTFYAAGLRPWRHRFPDLRAALRRRPVKAKKVDHPAKRGLPVGGFSVTLILKIAFYATR
jgi:hypothetical protein